jgi:hypothetical protein
MKENNEGLGLEKSFSYFRRVCESETRSCVFVKAGVSQVLRYFDQANTSRRGHQTVRLSCDVKVRHDLGRRKVTMKERKPDGPGALSRADKAGHAIAKDLASAVFLTLRLREKQCEELARRCKLEKPVRQAAKAGKRCWCGG